MIHARRIVDWFANHALQRQPDPEETERILRAVEDSDDLGFVCRVCGKRPRYQVSADVGEEVRHEFLCGDDLGPYIDLFCNWPEITVVRL